MCFFESGVKARKFEDTLVVRSSLDCKGDGGRLSWRLGAAVQTLDSCVFSLTL
jgi:hypothetical protein